MTEHRFQVNLGGIIELLSDHLYSGPQVFVRELLQNGVDAIAARRQLFSLQAHVGEMSMEIIRGRAASPGASGAPATPPTLVFEDNGIGLTEDEIHRFISTIGASSKRGADVVRPGDFIGQFGIGLLSCFVVCDQIVMVTRSAREPEQGTFEWRGRNDGTYEIRKLDRDIAPGTKVYLRCKEGSEDYFRPERVCELVKYFGGMLPVPVWFTPEDGVRKQLNTGDAPWSQTFATDEARHEAMTEFGRDTFGMRFPAHIPLRSAAGGVEGVAFVLPTAASIHTRQRHRVYLKRMLLTEKADNLLPDWAFFVRCAVNADKLRPTASRESFYEDAALATTRRELGQCIRDWLVGLSRNDPDSLARLIEVHYRAIKALAAEDDEFFEVIGDWLPFLTSHGQMTLRDIRREGVIRYTRSVDEFRQVSGVAAAEGLCLVCGGYVNEAELLEKVPEVFDDVSVEEITAADLIRTFEDLTLDEQDRTAAFLQLADDVLEPYRCGAELKRFQPTDLPALYSINAEGQFRRAAEQSKEVADSHWSGILDSLTRNRNLPDRLSELCFNWSSPLVRRLALLKDAERQKLAIGMLYVQAMLFAQQPLRVGEMKLLNTGLLGLIEIGLGDEAGDGDT